MAEAYRRQEENREFSLSKDASTSDFWFKQGNPIQDPESFGLTPVLTYGLPADDYAFYTAKVMKKDDGFYLTTDSGCSCPIPFESHSVGDLTGPLTASQVAEEITSLYDSSYKRYKRSGDKEELRDTLSALYDYQY